MQVARSGLLACVVGLAGPTGNGGARFTSCPYHHLAPAPSAALWCLTALAGVNNTSSGSTPSLTVVADRDMCGVMGLIGTRSASASWSVMVGCVSPACVMVWLSRRQQWTTLYLGLRVAAMTKTTCRPSARPATTRRLRVRTNVPGLRTLNLRPASGLAEAARWGGDGVAAARGRGWSKVQEAFAPDRPVILSFMGNENYPPGGSQGR